MGGCARAAAILKLHVAHCAFSCGAIQNPCHVEATDLAAPQTAVCDPRLQCAMTAGTAMTAMTEAHMLATADEPGSGTPPSPAGPVDPATPLHMPPARGQPALIQGLRLARRPMPFALASQQRFGDVWQLRAPT